jgi:hypothetical protein
MHWTSQIHTVLRLLERWPTQAELAAAGRNELVAFARAGRHGWPDRFAERIADALARPALVPRDYLVRAKAATIRLAVVQLLVLRAAHKPNSSTAPPGRPDRTSRGRSSPSLKVLQPTAPAFHLRLLSPAE